jgi:hypothetical protein
MQSPVGRLYVYWLGVWVAGAWLVGSALYAIFLLVWLRLLRRVSDDSVPVEDGGVAVVGPTPEGSVAVRGEQLQGRDIAPGGMRGVRGAYTPLEEGGDTAVTEVGQAGQARQTA